MSCSINNFNFIPNPSFNNGCNTSVNVGGNLVSCETRTSPAECCTKGITSRKKREKTREDIKDIVLAMLGASVIDVEITTQQLDIAIDYTLKIYEDYAPREYYEYYVFNTTPGKSVYEMPPDVGLIRNVFYAQVPIFAFNQTNLGAVVPLDYFYQGGFPGAGGMGIIDPIAPVWGRIGEWALYRGYERLYAEHSGQLGGWEWVSGMRHIKLFPIPCRCTGVVVHYLQKCKDWECVTEAMVEGTLAQVKIMLGRIRSKFKTIPGVQGGVVLDGEQILAEGREDWLRWREELSTRYGDLGPGITMG